MKLLAVSLNCLLCAAELSALAQNVSLPAGLNHAPISLVTVHCDLHTSAAGRDLDVEVIGTKTCDKFLKGLDIIKRRGLAYVTSVDENMDSHLCHALFLCANEHSLQVIDMRMHVTVRKKTDKVKCAIVCLCVRNKALPCVRRKHLAAFDRLGNQLCALRKYLTCAKCVVTDLGVTHVVIGGQTNCRTVSAERYHRVLCHKHIESGCVSRCDSICLGCGSDSHAVHNNSQNGTLYALEGRVLCQLVHYIILQFVNNIKYFTTFSFQTQ